MGEQMNTQNILQLVQETVPGTYDPNGAATVMVSCLGDFVPTQAWANFRPSGFNEDAWAAMETDYEMWQGTIRWDFGQAKTITQMLCGAPVVTTADSKTQYVYILPESGARNLDGSTFTLEFGSQQSCDRCPYALISSITLPAERAATTVEGQITIICQKAIATGVPMTGLATSYITQRIAFDNVSVNQEFAVRAAGTSPVFSFAPNATASAIKAGIEALAAYDGFTATITDNRNVTDGIYTGSISIAFTGDGTVLQLEVLQSESEVLTLDGVTGAGTWRGAAVTPGDSAATVQAAVRGEGGDNAAVVVTGSSAAGAAEAAANLEPTISPTTGDSTDSSAALNPNTNKIYLFGGVQSGYEVNTIQEFDTNSNTLSNKTATLSEAVGYVGACWSSAKSKFYTFGGRVGVTSKTYIQEYDPAADTIVTKSAVLPAADFALYAFEYSGKIRVISRFTGAIYEYDPAADSITTKSEAFTDLGGGSGNYKAARVNDDVYLMLGDNSSPPFPTTLQKYDMAAGTVSNVTVAGDASHTGTNTICANNTDIYCFGPGSTTEVRRFDTLTNTWKADESVAMATQSDYPAIVNVNGKAYIFGGSATAIQTYTFPAAGGGAYTAYFPYSVGNTALGSVSGSGFSVANLTQGDTAAENVSQSTLNSVTTGLTIPTRVPMLNKNFSVRRADSVADLADATPLQKAMMVSYDLSALISPIFFFDENVETFLSHVDGDAPVKKLGLRLSASSSDLASTEADANTQPATPRWYGMRGVHADNSNYSYEAQFFASPNAAVTLGNTTNVRYKEFPMGTVISGIGYACRFVITEPAA